MHLVDDFLKKELCFCIVLQSSSANSNSASGDCARCGKVEETDVISQEDVTRTIPNDHHTTRQTDEARLDYERLQEDNIKMREELLKVKAGVRDSDELQKEVESLHWQLNKVSYKSS